MRQILVALLLIAQSGSISSTQTTQRGSESTVAPAFSLKALNGRVAKLSDYKGKVVLINLWASWCAPCRMELPELVRLQRQYKARGLQIVGVTYPDDDAASVRRMTRQLKLNYPILFGTSELLDAYQIGEVLPATVIVDRDGIIRERILGILEPEEFKNRVAPLLQSTARP
jgi:thiol-disulfide isomerase/thioredoxin